MTNEKDLTRIVTGNMGEVTREWLAKLKADGTLQTGRIKEAELETECRRFLEIAAPEMFKPVDSAELGPIHDMLGNLSRSRALQGFTPSETSNFVLAVKLPLFDVISKQLGPEEQAQTMMALTAFVDRLALFTIETFQRSREEVIIRQQREIAELSTPVVRLWGGILALPLIGTLDSERTQVVMENMLQSIVEYSAEIAIIDITGVPTVDTLVAQHLLKTVAAARLMGADCLISGIRPQIAQTMVHLGVELNVVSKASLADALALAFQRVGLRVISTAPEARAGLA